VGGPGGGAGGRPVGGGRVQTVPKEVRFGPPTDPAYRPAPKPECLSKSPGGRGGQGGGGPGRRGDAHQTGRANQKG